MPPKAPPLTIDEIYKGCKYTLVTARDVRAMTRDECFSQCQSRNEQIVFARYFITENCFISASPISLGIIFNINPGLVSKILCKAKKQKKEIGRPLKIGAENEIIVINEILSKCDSYNLLTISQIIKFVEETFQIV